MEAVAFNFGAGNFGDGRPLSRLIFHDTLPAYTYLGFHEYGWPTMYPRRQRHQRRHLSTLHGGHPRPSMATSTG